MKKKLILGITGLLAFGAMICNVNAEAAALTSRIPTTIPSTTTPVYAATDEVDFSKFGFTSSTSGVAGIQGEKINRILLTTTPKTDATSVSETLGTDYFSAYCIDGDKKSPLYNLTSYSDADVKNKILFTLMNDSKLYKAFENVIGYTGATVELDDSTPESGYTDGCTMKVKKITFAVGSNVIDVKASDLDNAANSKTDSTATTFDVKVEESKIKLSNYTTTATGTKNYDKTLWIMEHSYPTISIEEALNAAGTNTINVMAELAINAKLLAAGKTLDEIAAFKESSTTNAANRTVTQLEKAQESLDTIYKCANNQLGELFDTYKHFIAEGLNEKAGYEAYTKDDITVDVCKNVLSTYTSGMNIDHYIYATVQYAIWNVTGEFTRNGGKLGDTLIGSTELNKLYQYLIKDRAETTNYSKLTFSKDVSISKLESGKEIYKDNKNEYIYGPYSVTGTAVSGSKFTISVVNNTKGVSIVDKDGNAVSEVAYGESFYVKCSKSEKITNVSISATGKIKTFSPETDRARIYYSTNPTIQNVMTGGKIQEVSVEAKTDLVFNPKTGVKNLAIIFVISLIAFSLGYLALNAKSQEINLD